jgi:hypothetical protein
MTKPYDSVARPSRPDSNQPASTKAGTAQIAAEEAAHIVCSLAWTGSTKLPSHLDATIRDRGYLSK